MGESQSEVDSEYRVYPTKRKRQNEEDPAKTGFGTGTMIDYQRNPSYEQQSFAQADDKEEPSSQPTRRPFGLQHLKQQIDHSLFVSETGTGLLVSFIPHGEEPPAGKPYVVESSMLEPSSGNRYQYDNDKEYLAGVGTNQDAYSDSRGVRKMNKNSLMGTIKTVSSKIMGSGKDPSMNSNASQHNSLKANPKQESLKP